MPDRGISAQLLGSTILESVNPAIECLRQSLEI
jgi:hypothetical protein